MYVSSALCSLKKQATIHAITYSSFDYLPTHMKVEYSWAIKILLEKQFFNDANNGWVLLYLVASLKIAKAFLLDTVCFGVIIIFLKW